MRYRALAILAVPLFAAACATTPRGQCEAPHRAQLRVVTAEISTTQADIHRGFRLVPAQWAFGHHYCLDPFGAARLCTAADNEPMYDRREINRAAERAKLAALVREQQRLTAALAACARAFAG